MWKKKVKKQDLTYRNRNNSVVDSIEDKPIIC